MTTIETTLDAAPRGATPCRLPGPLAAVAAIRNQIARIVMWAAFFLAIVPLVWILGTVVIKGGQLLLDVALVDQLPARASPRATTAAAPSTPSRAR